MFEWGTAQGINHLLRQQQWASQRLRSFAGKRVSFHSPPLPDAHFSINEDGLLGAARVRRQEETVDLTVTIKPFLPFMLPGQDLRAVRRDMLEKMSFDGDPALADVVRALVTELDWDYEEDLSRVVGDAMAHRVAETGRKFAAWPQEASMRFAQNAAEYFTEERPLIAKRADLDAFRAEVSTLEAEVSALEVRLTALQTRA